MNFAEFYSNRYSVASKIFDDDPRSNTGIIVVIPCYDDDFIFKTLDSLEQAQQPPCHVEVIVVVNSAEDTQDAIVEKNRHIYDSLREKCSQYSHFQLRPHIVEKVPHKIAGVGNARKIGMDEAVWRFASIDNPRGIIVSLDADCLVDKEYFTLIYKMFSFGKKKTNACTLQFQHNFDKNQYSEIEINACRRYEMYLRYFRLAQKVAGIPNCLHTIGSCFAVIAEAYAKMGGMSRRQAGEDFYFLQKLALQSYVDGVAKPIVFPAPSISTRVPFGTGQAVKKIVEQGTCPVYNFNLFLILKAFYSKIADLHANDEVNIPSEIMNFVGNERLLSIVHECRENTSNEKGFIKRMTDKFDVFFMIRFLNGFGSESKFPPQEVESAAKSLLEYYGEHESGDLYKDLLSLDVKARN